MDGKYNGCNIVESVVTEKPSQPVAARPKRGGRLLLRIVISAVIVAFILVLHYFPNLPIAGEAVGFLRRVFCYDVFGRGSFGASAFFG